MLFHGGISRMDLHFAMHPDRKKRYGKFHGYKNKAMHVVA